MPIRFLILFVFTAALITGMVQSVSACSCGPRPAVLDAFEYADEVVIMRVVSLEKIAKPEAKENKDEEEVEEENEGEYVVDGVRTATLMVEKVFKGKLKVREEIVFGQGTGGNCIWTFNEETLGDQFLFYLNRPEKRPDSKSVLWYAVGCGRSRGLAGATEDLLYLENMKKYRGKTRISGSLSGGWEYPDIDVAEKKIKIIGPNKTYETKTDKDGVFELYDLPAGKYFIEPEMPPGWKIDAGYLRYSSSAIGGLYGQPELKTPKQVAIKLEAKRHASINIHFEVENFVRGTVVGPTAKPMSGVCVSLLRTVQAQWGPSDCTNEQGQFEITSIPPGEYVLVANQDDKPSDRQPFRRIYYPNVAEHERATVLRLGPGDVIENIDLFIPKLEETITITGVLRYSDGKPVDKKWIRFVVTKANEKVSGDVNLQTDSAGKFTLRVLKGLTGELFGDEWLLEGLYKNCPKVNELLAKDGSNNTTVRSNVVALTAEENLYDVELTLPFPRCERASQ